MTLREGKEIKPPQILTIKRIAWTLAGLLWFLWIGYEDQGLTPILILAAAITFPIGLEFYLRHGVKGNHGQVILLIRGMAVGALSGALVGPISLLLASLKTSLHQHGMPDFRTDDLILLIERTPIWAMTGLLFGTAASIFRWSKQNNSR